MTAARKSTEPGAGLTIEADDRRLAPYRSRLPASEFAALHAWLTTFERFQLDWLLEEARFAVANKARQIGWSHTTAGQLVLWGAFRGEPNLVLSVGQDEADEVISKCAWHVRQLRAFGSESASVTRPPSTSEIVFSSGGRIVALPSTGGRSFTGNLFLDEYAYHQNPTKVWDAASPASMLGYRIRVVSTPNGAGNDFHALWESARNPRDGVPATARWATREVPLQVAIDEGYPIDLDACWSVYAKGDPRLFAQMFGCSFLDNVLQYIQTDKIRACFSKRPLEADERGLYYAGLDIGREADLSVIVVVKVVRGVAEVVHVESMKRTDSDGLEAMVAWAFKRYRLRRLCIDETGLGTFPAERIKKKHGDRLDLPHRRNKVEPIKFGLVSKEALATNLYTAVTDGKVVLPAGDEHLATFERWNEDDGGRRVGTPVVVNPPGTAAALATEIASLQRVVTPSGNVTYETPRTKDGHADRAWSLMLALFAVDKVHPMVAALQSRMGAGA